MGLKPSAVPDTNPAYLPKHLTHQTCQDGQQSILHSNFDSEMSEIVPHFKDYYFPYLQYLCYFLCLLVSLLTARFSFFIFMQKLYYAMLPLTFLKSQFSIVDYHKFCNLKHRFIISQFLSHSMHCQMSKHFMIFVQLCTQ